MKPKKFLLIGLFVPGLSMAQTPVSSKPEFKAYEIHVRREMTQAKDQHGSVQQFVYFGRADGSKGVRSTERAGQRSCTTATIWDTAARTKTTASDCTQLKSTVPARQIPAPALALDTCRGLRSGWVFAGAGSVAGVRVERFRKDDNRVSAEASLAPELGCLQLQSVHRWKDEAGAITGTTSDEAASVMLGRFDAALFAIPASYREASPSSRLSALHRHLFPGHGEDCASAGGARADAEYERARAEPLR